MIKFFHIDVVYNSQKEEDMGPTRTGVDARGAIKRKRKFPTKIMIWSGACSAGLPPLVILDKRRSIKLWT